MSWAIIGNLLFMVCLNSGIVLYCNGRVIYLKLKRFYVQRRRQNRINKVSPTQEPENTSNQVAVESKVVLPNISES